MVSFAEEITAFLDENGFVSDCQVFNGISIIHVYGSHGSRYIFPVSITFTSPEDAYAFQHTAVQALEKMRAEREYPIVITEDRWHNSLKTMQKRILAHLGRFIPVYARNCEIRRIGRQEAADFLKETHSYGDAACRYRYGMFVKRNTGSSGLHPGDLVAVAEFSNARKWMKGEKIIRSYEWTRYASLPDTRVTGGMGKFLRHFIEEVNPDDIMSYADLEWSEGDVYEKLGFSCEGLREPVLFCIDKHSWIRKAMKGNETGELYLLNFGSRKYRLKLTDYR